MRFWNILLLVALLAATHSGFLPAPWERVCAETHEPNLQRWLNRDPIGEAYDANLFRLNYNSPLNFVDSDGLTGWVLNNPARWWDPDAPDLDPRYRGPTCEELEIWGAIAGVVNEPMDWAMTGSEIWKEPRNPWSYAGLVPFLPSAVGKTAKKVHGNSKDSDRLTRLYKLVDKDGNLLKWGITSLEKIESRYRKSFLANKYIERVFVGTREAMMQLERRLVESNPGPLNRERWAGKDM